MHPDYDAAYRVEGIGGSVMPSVCGPGVVDLAERVSDEESFATARRLIRAEGLLVGGSSGTAVAAALRVAARGCNGPVVALLADSWNRYLSRPVAPSGGLNGAQSQQRPVHRVAVCLPSRLNDGS
jgi:cysteine synthase